MLIKLPLIGYINSILHGEVLNLRVQETDECSLEIVVELDHVSSICPHIHESINFAILH